MIERVWFFHCGWARVPETVAVGDGSSKRLRALPFLAMAAQHSELGVIVIDAPFGHEGPGSLGAVLGAMMRMTSVRFEREWGIIARLESLGLRASQVQHVLMTHLHFDHTGGMKALAHATFHASRRDWTQANSWSSPFDALRNGYLLSDYRALQTRVTVHDAPAPITPETPGLDLFGDGSVEAFALPGHTPGHTGYRLRMADGRRVFFLGDAIFQTRQLHEDVPQGLISQYVSSSQAEVQASIAQARAIASARPDDLYLCSHDFELGERCKTGPVAL